MKEMQRLDWSLSRKVTQDIKTQPQINHYQSISVLCSYRLLSVLCCGFLSVLFLLTSFTSHATLSSSIPFRTRRVANEVTR